MACSVRTFRNDWKAKLTRWAGEGKKWVNGEKGEAEDFDDVWKELFDGKVRILFRCD